MNDETFFKTFHQSQLFALDSEDKSNREKTERLRQTMFFYHGLLTQDKISFEAHRVLSSRLSSEYSSIIDNPENSQGNFDCETQLSFEDRQPVCPTKEKKEKEDVTVRISFSKFNKSQRHEHPSFKNNKNNTRNMSNSIVAATEKQMIPLEKRKIPVFGKRKACVQASMPASENVPAEKSRLLQDRNHSTKSIVYGNEHKNSMPKFNEGRKDIENNVDSEEDDNPFRTAREQLLIGQLKNKNSVISADDYGNKKRSLGTRRTGLSGKFVPPVSKNEKESLGNGRQAYNYENDTKKHDSKNSKKYEGYEWMKNIDERMIELIENEIMDHGQHVNWEDIAGLEFAKTTIQEIVIWPMLRPDIFTGLRGPPKGLLLFGPPGTGKTLIGKCIASQSNATFFSISASSLTSKWVGEGEKMVRALFGVARCHQPSVIFIDEIDSLLTSRSDSEHESSRRIKTEFLVQLDGATCTTNERILVVGATNRPQELDEAARRRLVKRLYIPLPDSEARSQIIVNLLRSQSNDVSQSDLNIIASKTDGFSGADMATLCREAALGPIRTISDIRNINANDVRPVNINDFVMALRHVRPSVSKSDLQIYIDWNSTYGCCGGEQ